MGNHIQNSRICSGIILSWVPVTHKHSRHQWTVFTGTSLDHILGCLLVYSCLLPFHSPVDSPWIPERQERCFQANVSWWSSGPTTRHTGLGLWRQDRWRHVHNLWLRSSCLVITTGLETWTTAASITKVSLRAQVWRRSWSGGRIIKCPRIPVFDLCFHSNGLGSGDRRLVSKTRETGREILEREGQ